LDFFGPLPLKPSNHDVFATPVATASFIQHAVVLADTQCISQENLKFRAPLFAFLGLHLPKESRILHD